MNEIYCPHGHHTFARDYSRMIEQSCVKAICVQTSCPWCRKPLFFIAQKGYVLYFKDKNELFWAYQLLLGKS